MTTNPSIHHTCFELLRRQAIASLHITIEEYRHKATGAMHYHLAADNDENVFLVALRTVPHDSRGVAHILEHTVLCGSERYPVRDPFFLMIRRSLNTFMNAFTSSDWTAYPFASQNKADFNNLLDVYLDAVFFARLDPLDFAQEGHRIEWEETDNPDSALVFKGVVFNEMKGAMSSTPSTLWQILCEQLYPTSTYHYNSGGDPAVIPDLSYEDLMRFYKTHYHPSNAIFMTYGNIPAIEHQQQFEERVLSRFQTLDHTIAVTKEQRYTQPQRAQAHYAFNEADSTEQESHIMVAWLLGESACLKDRLHAQFLANVLLGHSASPLQRALETTSLGRAPSPLCGLETSMREMAFVCGIEGGADTSTDAVETLVLDTLQHVATHGVPQEELEAVLYQLELHQREIGGDHYPLGLELILTALSSATHRGDPVAVLDLDPILEQLRQAIQDPNFIKTLTRELLLDNTHRVTLLVTPDTTLDQRQQTAEVEKLSAIKAKLTEQDKQQISERARTLAQRQNAPDDASVLPKVGLADIPSDTRTAEGTTDQLGGIPLQTYATETNGVVYQQLQIELPALSDDLITLLPYYSNSITELGIGQQDYLATQALQASTCGKLHAYSRTHGMANNVQHSQHDLAITSNALYRHQTAQAALMYDTLHHVRFDEQHRLQELLQQHCARQEQAIVQNGHLLAMTAASAGISPSAQLHHQLSGLQGIQTTKKLSQRIKDKDHLADYVQQLSTLHQHIIEAPKRYLLIGEQDHLTACQQTLQQQWHAAHATTQTTLNVAVSQQAQRQWWVTHTQVNFCAKAYPTVSITHPDAAALTVLGGFLRNGFLHRTIREQGGAYGGGAGQDSSTGAFRFFSYRDPRLTDTLQDFDQAIDWLLHTQHQADALEEAILGVIASIDKPSSPAGNVKCIVYQEQWGYSAEKRRHFREQVLSASIKDLQRVADHYLKAENASVAVLTNPASTETLQNFIQQDNFTVFHL